MERVLQYGSDQAVFATAFQLVARQASRDTPAHATIDLEETKPRLRSALPAQAPHSIRHFVAHSIGGRAEVQQSPNNQTLIRSGGYRRAIGPQQVAMLPL